MKEGSQEWNDRVHFAVKKLIDYASTTPYKNKDPYLSYKQFEGLVGLPIDFINTPQLTPFLRNVCQEIKGSHLTTRDILLSAIVATEGSGILGPGFFELAKEIGFTQSELKDKTIFSYEQRKKVFEFYQNI